MSSPPLSVCMATYNGGRFVAEQVSSILAQLSLADELVISDDSSTDGTLNLLRQFDDPRIRILENNRFASPIFNFQNALGHARHDVLVLSDQDDVWSANKADLIRTKFSDPPTKHYATVLDGVVTDQDGNEVHPSIFQRINSGPGILKNIYDNTFLGCCMAFTRHSLELALPFPPKIPMHDMWIGLTTSAFGLVEFVPEKTIRYRKHNASVTDFRRAFRPWLQIRRRAYLSFNLAKRVIERRADKGQPKNLDVHA